MAKGKINIAFIGGGKTGTPLLKQLLETDFISLAGIADLDINAPGIQMAKEKGVFTTNDYMELVHMGKQIDILIDVTGVPEVGKNVIACMNEMGNKHTVVMREIIAILMMSLAKGELIETYHGYQKYA